MKIRYYVSGIGYDENNEVTDYEQDFGDFDTYVEAYELFVKVQCRSAESFFENASEVYEVLIQLEECEETEEEITCVDVKNEWWITNPKISRRKRAYEAYKLTWMIQHGYTLADLIKEIGAYMEESEEDIVCSFDGWEFDCGFNGEIWACYEEFCENEYQDKEYIKRILGRNKL